MKRKANLLNKKKKDNIGMLYYNKCKSNNNKKLKSKREILHQQEYIVQFKIKKINTK